MRRNPHCNSGRYRVVMVAGIRREFLLPPRRQHGVAKNVLPTALTTRSADKRAALYRNSSAAKRAFGSKTERRRKLLRERAIRQSLIVTA